MKAVKDLEHGLLLSHFTQDDKHYYVVSILTFFGFDDPAAQLSEQELWPFVQTQLGGEQVLDAGMPKPNGEVLVWGSCFAPEEKPVKILNVSFQAGPIMKSLAVFGKRFWKRQAGLVHTATDIQPFLRMPVS